jgi:hypothetical protein
MALSVSVDEFYCPITNNLMEDPVMTKYGHTFEKSAIMEWLQNTPRCPLTNQALTPADIFPNRSLKALLDTHKDKLQPKRPPKQVLEAAEPGAVPAEEKKQDEEVALIAKVYSTENSEYQLLEVTAPQDAEPMPMAVILTIDVSGSMDERVYVKGEDGKEKSDGLTKLDLVKHAAVTIIQTLRDSDQLGLVVYANKGEIVLKCSAMTEAGKKEATLLVRSLRTKGSTNLWDGIRVSLEEMESVAQLSPQNVNRQIMLLTDGVPTDHPPRGEVQTLSAYLTTHPLNCCLNAFGFGYSLMSDMLQKIAIIGQGSYAFIPDGGFVGTAFINAMAYAMTVVARKITVCLPKDAVVPTHCPFNVEASGESSVIELGCIGFAQSKFVAIKKGAGEFVVKYSKLSEAEVQIDDVISIVDQPRVFEKHLKILAAKKLLSKLSTENLAGGKTVVEKAIQELDGEADQEVEDLAVDLKGQVSEAFSQDQYLRKWGLHYVRSLSLAHANRVCINFKDPGVQHYGGKKFNSLRDEYEKVFLTVTPPTPSMSADSFDPVTKAKVNAAGGAPAAPVSMAAYYNMAAGCFTGETMVELSKGGFKQIQHLRKEDVVRSVGDSEARIVCVVKTIVGGPCQIVRLGGDIALTYWHPIKNSSDQWCFPAELHPEQKTVELHEAVYNLVLDEGHEIVLGNKENQVAAVTLAHGNTVDPVLKHAYFGTQAVVEDLMTYRGWDDGFVEIQSSHFKRDPQNGLINKISQS